MGQAVHIEDVDPESIGSGRYRGHGDSGGVSESDLAPDSPLPASHGRRGRPDPEGEVLRPLGEILRGVIPQQQTGSSFQLIALGA